MTAAFNRTFAVLLLFCVTQVVSCSAPHEPAATGASASFPPITLGDRDGRMQLALRRVKAPAENRWASVLGLRAYDEELLGAPAAGSLSDLWLDGEAVPMAGTDRVRIIEQRSSNDWTYASVDLAPLPAGRVRRFTRHLLHVEPDLFIICDEVVLTEPATVEVGWWFPAGVARDAAREEWRLQLPKAGVTARILASPRNRERLWPAGAGSQHQAANARDAVCVRSGTTNKTVEFRQVTALVPHAQDGGRSLAFKLLESDSAIGMRVHRDGLPTLIAIRTDAAAAEANLTGLKFTGPVAVDIFRPKRR
jgi:hypothetical protein